MRIVHICQRDDPREGGAYRVPLEFMACQRAVGIDSHILYLYGAKGPSAQQFGERAHYLSIQSPKKIWQLFRLIKTLKRLKPNIVHDHQPVLWSTLLTCVHPKWKLVTHAHTGAGVRSFGWKTRLTQLLQRRSTDLLVCISADTQQSWVQSGDFQKSQTAVVMNGVNRKDYSPPTKDEQRLAREQFGLPEQAVVVGFVGRLHNVMKGADDLVKAAAYMPENTVILIVGAGPDEKSLRDLAKSLNVEKRVVFTGLVAKPRTAYCALNVFCLTSHFENFGLVVAEAMACGLPTVRFACPGGVNDFHTPEVGWIVPNREPKALAEAVLTAHAEWQSPEASSARRLAVEKLLSTRLSWEANSAELVYLYQTLLKKT